VAIVWCLLVPILLVVIGAFSIGGYWCLFYWWLSVPLLLVAISAYFIGGY